MHHQISVHPKTAKKKMILNWICEYLFPNATCFEPWEKFYFLPSSFSTLAPFPQPVVVGRNATQQDAKFSQLFLPTQNGIAPVTPFLSSVWWWISNLNRSETEIRLAKKSKEKYWKRDAFGAFFGSPCAIRSGSFFIPAHEAFCSKFNFQPHSGCVVVWRLGWGEQETIGRLERGSVCCLFM